MCAVSVQCSAVQCVHVQCACVHVQCCAQCSVRVCLCRAVQCRCSARRGVGAHRVAALAALDEAEAGEDEVEGELARQRGSHRAEAQRGLLEEEGRHQVGLVGRLRHQPCRSVAQPRSQCVGLGALGGRPLEKVELQQSGLGGVARAAAAQMVRGRLLQCVLEVPPRAVGEVEAECGHLQRACTCTCTYMHMRMQCACSAHAVLRGCGVSGVLRGCGAPA